MTWIFLRLRNKLRTRQLLAKWDRMDAELEATTKPYEPTT